MQKFVLLPYDRFEALTQNKSSPNNVKTTFSNIGLKTNSEIRTENFEQSERERQQRELVLCCFNKVKRNQAEKLLDFINESQLIDYNKRGEVILHDLGTVIPGSNISDLIQDALRATSAATLIGSKEFYERILPTAPQSLVRNKSARKKYKYLAQLPMKTSLTQTKKIFENSIENSTASEWSKCWKKWQM